MKKKSPPKNTKKDFEKVYENPLDWCPLLGYIPDKIPPIFKTRPVTIDPHGHEDTLSAYDYARDVIDEIVEARTFWGINESFYNYFPYQRLPDIEMVSEKNKFEAARWLFITLFRVAHVGTHYNELIDQWTPFISMRAWKHYEGHVLDRSPEALLRHTQREINMAGEFIGFNYTLSADEVYALFALHEAWIMLIRLLKNEFTPDNEDLLSKSLVYREKCLDHADTQRHIKKLYINNNELKDEIDVIEKTALPLIKEKEAQRSRGKSLGHIRQPLIGIQLAVDNLKKDHPTYQNLYKHIFKNHCVNDDLIDALCRGEDVRDKFIECEDGINLYYVFMMKDEEKPENPFAAYIYQIQEADSAAIMKKTMDGIKYSTYRSEYFYKRKRSHSRQR